jgi:transcriptional regulator with XRE-family HTH domain
MPEQCKSLSNISAALREQVLALQALGEPRDHVLPDAMQLLLAAIDPIDLSARKADQIACAPLSPGTYLRQQREAEGVAVEELALRLNTDPALSLLRRIAWIQMIEADVAPISGSNAAAYLGALRLDLKALGCVVRLIREREDVIVATELPTAPTTFHDRARTDA